MIGFSGLGAEVCVGVDCVGDCFEGEKKAVGLNPDRDDSPSFAISMLSGKSVPIEVSMTSEKETVDMVGVAPP